MCAYVCVSDYISIFNFQHFLILFTTLLCTPTICMNDGDDTTNCIQHTPAHCTVRFPLLLGMFTFFLFHLLTIIIHIWPPTRTHTACGTSTQPRMAVPPTTITLITSTTTAILSASTTNGATTLFALTNDVNGGEANLCHHHPHCPDCHHQRNCHHLTTSTPMRMAVMPTATIPCIHHTAQLLSHTRTA